MDKAIVTRYFEENSASWVEFGYTQDAFNYPVGLSRLEKTVKILGELLPDGPGTIADLGCGAGNLCLELARYGHIATGVDESKAMISQALDSLSKMPKNVRSKVQFLNTDLLDNQLGSQSFDAVTSLGVIGYLPDDGPAFNEARRLLGSNGIFIVSCRNRLFNMVSISDYTLKEIREGAAPRLIEEIRELYQEIPEEDATNFQKLLASTCTELDSLKSHGLPDQPLLDDAKFTSVIEARQHTPRELAKTAKIFGFEPVQFYGVHPHLMMAGLNKMMPPGYYNLLSRALEALDHLPVSLIWSSVFIAVFRKTT